MGWAGNETKGEVGWGRALETTALIGVGWAVDLCEQHELAEDSLDEPHREARSRVQFWEDVTFTVHKGADEQKRRSGTMS